jgi:hypothetical protein
LADEAPHVWGRRSVTKKMVIASMPRMSALAQDFFFSERIIAAEAG